MEDSGINASDRSSSAWGRILSIALTMAILGGLGMLGYTIAAPKAGERFTEFYILGLGGKAMDYPFEIMVGEEGRVIIGIVNKEQEAMSYKIEVRIDGVKCSETEPILLGNGEQWEEAISFIADSPGDHKKVEFLLYRNNDTTPHLKPLYFWVNVAE